MPDNALATQGGGSAPAVRETSQVGLFQRQLEDRARDIQMALPAHITPDKFQRTILTAVAQNPDLLKADRGSLILSCYKAAQDALLPDGREAALVTFNTRFKDPADGQWKSKKLVQYMPMVYGLRKKILQSAEVVSLEVNVVYRTEVEKGTFLYEVGLEPPLRHRPSLDLTEEETADDQIVAAYSIATMKDGTKSYEIMRRFEINKVRQVSQTGAVGRTDRQGKPIEPKGPWVDWFAEMAKKTVMRRHAKTLPMSGDVLLDVEGRELERGSSAALALGSQTPDEPLAIEDNTTGLVTDDSGDTIDTSTGEVVATAGDGDGDNASGEPVSETAKAEPEPETAKPARARRGRQAETAEEPAETGKTDQAQAGAAGEATAQASEPAQSTSGQDEFTPDPFEEKGDQYLARFEKAENVIDLDTAKKEFDAESEGWPYDVIQGVELGYRRHQRRLAPARQAEELEPAK